MYWNIRTFDPFFFFFFEYLFSTFICLRYQRAANQLLKRTQPFRPSDSQPKLSSLPKLPYLGQSTGGVGNTHTAQLGLSKVKEIWTKNR